MADKEKEEKVIEMSFEDIQENIVIPACTKAHMVSGLIFFHIVKLKFGKDSEENNKKINDAFRAWADASINIYGEELAGKYLEESFEFYRKKFLKTDNKRSWSISADDLKLKKEDKK